MAWEKLDTPDILAVKYYPSKQILKARLKSGHLEIYKHVTETRYRELLAGSHPYDIDTFFLNIIRPNRVAVHQTLKSGIYRLMKFLAYLVIVLAILALLGLWNSGLLDVYFAKAIPNAP